MHDVTLTDYCLISKTLIEDRLVTPKAKAMYAVLCWCPPGFNCSFKNLSEVLGVRPEVASQLIKELEDNGYIERRENSKPIRYHVHPSPRFLD